MCRRCGEPDRRGPAYRRRERREWLASPESLHGGDGRKVECWNYSECGQILDLEAPQRDPAFIEVDRIIPGWQCRTCKESVRNHARKRHTFDGGTYRRENIRPSCAPCNRRRNQGNPWNRHDPDTRCMIAG